uniref:Uncharacterized protein n=1 Tax=Arundo donax TaxID=35708 RepID=A0A0A9HIL7_ARUDO
MVLMVISLVRSGEGKGEGFEDVARYWARVKDGRFALSYLDKQVFSWSVKDVFDKDLFRNKE